MTRGVEVTVDGECRGHKLTYAQVMQWTPSQVRSWWPGGTRYRTYLYRPTLFYCSTQKASKDALTIYDHINFLVNNAGYDFVPVVEITYVFYMSRILFPLDSLQDIQQCGYANPIPDQCLWCNFAHPITHPLSVPKSLDRYWTYRPSPGLTLWLTWGCTMLLKLFLNHSPTSDGRD
jgi:hypothetical protein